MAKKKAAAAKAPVEGSVEAPKEDLLPLPKTVPVAKLANGQYYVSTYNGEFVAFEVGISQDAAPEGQLLVAQLIQGVRQNGQFWDRKKLRPAMAVTKEQAYNLSRDPHYYGEGYSFG